MRTHTRPEHGYDTIAMQISLYLCSLLGHQLTQCWLQSCTWFLLNHFLNFVWSDKKLFKWRTRAHESRDTFIFWNQSLATMISYLHRKILDLSCWSSILLSKIVVKGTPHIWAWLITNQNPTKSDIRSIIYETVIFQEDMIQYFGCRCHGPVVSRSSIEKLLAIQNYWVLARPKPFHFNETRKMQI